MAKVKVGNASGGGERTEWRKFPRGGGRGGGENAALHLRAPPTFRCQKPFRCSENRLEMAACFKVHYRVSHLLVHLGWVDFDCECSPVCLILPGLMGIWQKRLIKMGKLV